MSSARSMTPHERARDIVYRSLGKAFSRAVFYLILEDDGAAGKDARELVRVIEKGIEEDRAAILRATAPS